MVVQNRSVPVIYFRGGTSKALFFHEQHVPPRGTKRDRFLQRIMGSPDPLQIDGMGGSHLVTSKIALIKSSDQPDVDVDYTFVQVGINEETVSYKGNCGNISAAVGPFAVDEGFVKELRPGVTIDPTVTTQEVRIYNTGTKKVLISHVPINHATGKFVELGTFAIAGCPGSGSPILMDYSNVIGAALSSGVLPTSNSLDTIVINDSNIDITICDVGNIIVFARAKDLGLAGNEKPSDLDNDPALIARVRELRGKAAQMVGMCKNWELVDAQSPMLPMVALVSPPTDSDCDVQSRLFLDNKCHTSMAGTGAICTAACSRVDRSVVNQLLTERHSQKTTLNIEHPLGSIPVLVKVRSTSSQKVPEFETLSFVRTARRILEGSICVPDNVKDCFEEAEHPKQYSRRAV
ncbi:uncharacterized protein A1O5_11215 [Cladophialophora psammophila CBS 110553]|uniref:Methylitaconate delta2-delta3-isomerase n=1 Tax=Cladophialophora psammophila CBS 110553 TaxID=1182543 RepID=W9WCJ7_9EURO|nr:uncharacterized protein A1O5_11215 [Cladophialophora psammophila CBS 110553]EXJ65688.1 hypothetical protein A1O5_11215 [Cladophialophora psammophila CBS 110553]